jgi:ABC-type transport system involved in multi-copper enzyme maturation permease subunit
MIGESNAKSAERTFLLSRPLSRDAYMFGKIMSTLTFTVGMAVIIMLMWASLGIISLTQH